jgi:hypothetical protein
VERIGAAKFTYLKVEKGNSTVSVDLHAMMLFLLGFGDAIGELVDPHRDDSACCSMRSGLPKRVRLKNRRPR